MIGIALVGAGYAGRIQLAGWLRLPNVRVVGIWNRTTSRARALAQEFGVPCFDDLEALVGHPTVQAVDVATALETHLEFTRLAASAGKHVLCQKPLAPTLNEAAAMLEACSRAGVRLMVNENWRWRPWYRAVRALLDQGAVGRPFFVRLSSRVPFAIVTPEQPLERIFAHEPFLRAERRLILLHVGPHYVDVARFLCGDPSSVYVRMQKITTNVVGEEVVTMILGYPDRTVLVDLSWATVADPPVVHPDLLVVEGTEGTLTVGPDGQIDVRCRDGRRDRVIVDTADAYQRSWTAALAHFVDCLESGAAFETHGAHGLATMRIVLAGYESAATGQVITLTDP